MRPDGVRPEPAHARHHPGWLFGLLADSRTIAYTSEVDGDAEIFTMRADGTHARQLTTPARQRRPGLVSGAQLVFESNRDGDFEVFSMQPTGKR